MEEIKSSTCFSIASNGTEWCAISLSIVLSLKLLKVIFEVVTSFSLFALLLKSVSVSLILEISSFASLISLLSFVISILGVKVVLLRVLVELSL